jgi:hypothetical protein
MDLREKIEAQWAKSDRLSQRGLWQFLLNVVIDSKPQPRRFGEIADDWQWARFKPLVPAIEFECGYREKCDGPKLFWFTEPKGHDKTSRIARICNWCLGYSKKPVRICTAASDLEQAGFIVEAMEAEVGLNPWLAERVTVGRRSAHGTGGRLRVLTADAPSNSGLNDNIYILDEVTMWQKRDLWDILYGASEKRQPVFIIITNAGTRGTWQHKAFLNAKGSNRWFTFEVPEGQHLASWMSRERIQELKAELPRGFAKRMYDNKWIDAAEEADFLTRAEVEACEKAGTEAGLTRRFEGLEQHSYVAGIDYGPKRDRTALCVLHRNLDGVVIVDRLDVWQGSPDSPVSISRVEQWLDEVIENFNNPTLVFDDYQMQGTIEKYQTRTKVETWKPRGGAGNYEMAECIRSLISNKRLWWWTGADELLRPDGTIESFGDELLGLKLVPTTYGYRFDHESEFQNQRSFHDDRTVAVGMASVWAMRDPVVEFVEPGGLTKKQNIITAEDYHLQRRDSIKTHNLFGLGRYSL